MRALAFVLVVLSIVGCTSTQTEPPVYPRHQDLAADITNKTVALVARNVLDEARPYCTGTWVTRTDILTANHCVAKDFNLGDSVDYVVKMDVFAPGAYEANATVKTRRAMLVATDPEHDLALLRADVPPIHSVALVSITSVVQGMPAMTMGHSIGLWWSFSSGEVGAVRQVDVNDMDIKWVQTTTPVSPGNSGGALYDADGYVIGVCHGSFTRGQLLNLFVHRDYIGPFLAAHKALPQ